MALSNIRKSGYNSAITLTDGTPTTPLTFEVTNANMDFTLSGVSPNNLRTVVDYQVRGKHASSGLTERIYPTGSFSFQFTEFTEASEGTLYDFVYGQGAYAERVTVNENPQVLAFDITLTIEGTDLGDSADHTIILKNCRVEMDNFYTDGDPSSGSLAFTVLGDITGDIEVSDSPA